MTTLENQLRALRSSGRKALVPYLMGGVAPGWTNMLEAVVSAGADVVEIGLPFSDPMMDGVVIQAAAERALASGATLDSICDDLRRVHVGVPLVAMTYFNVFHHYGLTRAAARLRDAGISGVILPDLPIEEATEWRQIAAEHDIATVFMVAPSTTPARFDTITMNTQGFCYASARMSVTGRASGDGDAARVVEAVRAVSDVPTYIGIGITTPEQARAATELADGVIIGSAIVEKVLQDVTIEEFERFIGSYRSAIDTGSTAAE